MLGADQPVKALLLTLNIEVLPNILAAVKLVRVLAVAVVILEITSLTITPGGSTIAPSLIKFSIIVSFEAPDGAGL